VARSPADGYSSQSEVLGLSGGGQS
jgi:hypothetical protein